MTIQSLSELRDEIATQEAEVKPVVVVEDSDVIEAEVLQEETQNHEGESSENTGEPEEKPEWTKTDQQVPVAKYVDLKHKLKAKTAEIDQRASEIESLRQEVESLKRGQPVVTAQPVLKPPTLEECGWDESVFQAKNAQYVEALIESKLTNHTQRATQTQQVQQAQDELNREVDKHYERVSGFVAKGVVSEDNYLNADAVVRNRLNAVRPDIGGDQLANTLIANLGEGSEKVIYHLGVNSTAMMALENHLRSDPSGLRAAAYLGELKAKFNSAPINKLSNAPKPDSSLKGNVNVGGKTFKSAYDKAEASGDISGMLKAKREAKAAKVDTSKWWLNYGNVD